MSKNCCARDAERLAGLVDAQAAKHAQFDEFRNFTAIGGELVEQFVLLQGRACRNHRN